MDQILTPPSGFTMPFTGLDVIWSPNGTVRSNYDWSNPCQGTTYYVDSATGNDSNSGLTEAAPKLTINTLWSTTGGIKIKAKGDFHWTEFAAFDGQLGQYPGRHISIERWGTTNPRFINGPKRSSLTWSSAGSGAYSTTLAHSLCYTVIDETTIDKYGIAVPLTARASVGSVQSSGGWYRSGTTLTVKIPSGTDPTSVVQVIYLTTSMTAEPLDYFSTIFYLANVEFWGWRIRHQMAASITTQLAVAVNSKFLYGIEATTGCRGVAANGSTNCQSAIYNCISAYGYTDNLVYAGGTGGYCQALEENCTSYRAGWGNTLDLPNQNSTTHTQTTMVRINGIYEEAAGQNIADTGAASQLSYSWNVGVKARNSRSTGPSRNIDIESNTASYTTGWNTFCDLRGSTTTKSFAGTNYLYRCQYSGTIDTATSYTQLVNNNLSIDSIWGATTRTLTSFGTLVADTATAVWAASTRILTAISDSSGVTTLLTRITGAVPTNPLLTNDARLNNIDATISSRASESNATANTNALGVAIVARATQTSVDSIASAAMTSQRTRDAMKLAASAGTAVSGSIDAKIDTGFTTNQTEHDATQAAIASLASSVNVTVLPASVTQQKRQVQSSLYANVDALSTLALTVYSATGLPVELNGKDLSFCVSIEDEEAVKGSTVLDSVTDIAVGGDDSNVATFYLSATMVAIPGRYLWSLRDTSNGDEVLAKGDFIVGVAAND